MQDKDCEKERLNNREKKTPAQIATDYIEILLNKDMLTGEECGRVLMYDFVNGTDRASNTAEDYQKWFAINKKLRIIIPKLNANELSIYRYFISLQHWMTRTYSTTLGHYNKSQSEMWYFYEIVDRINKAEHIYPLVMRLLKDSIEQKQAELKSKEQITEASYYSKEKGNYDISAFPDELLESLINRMINTPVFIFEMMTLDKYNSKFPTGTEYSKVLLGHKMIVEQSYYYVRGYNIAIEMIAKHIKINEFIALKFNIGQLEKFNNSYDILSDTIKRNSEFLSQDRKESKQKTISNIFAKIDFKNLQPSKENITKAKKILDKGKAFSGDYEFINLLTKR